MRTPDQHARHDLGFPLMLTVGLIALLGAAAAFLQMAPH
jgi:hypothetical protein